MSTWLPLADSAAYAKCAADAGDVRFHDNKATLRCAVSIHGVGISLSDAARCLNYPMCGTSVSRREVDEAGECYSPLHFTIFSEACPESFRYCSSEAFVVSVLPSCSSRLSRERFASLP